MNILLIIMGIAGFIACGLSFYVLKLHNEISCLKGIVVMSRFNEQYTLQHNNYLVWAHNKGKRAEDCDEDLAMIFYYKGKYDASCEMIDATMKEVENTLKDYKNNK